MVFPFSHDPTRRKEVEGIHEGDSVEYQGLIWTVKEIHWLPDNVPNAINARTYAILKNRKGNYIEATIGVDITADNVTTNTERTCPNIIPRKSI